jgi:hypothetical protein
MLNLYNAYEAVGDNQISTYVMVTRFGYHENPSLYNPRTLMEGVENLYKYRVVAGTWNPGLANNGANEIAVLKAKLAALKKKTKKRGQR